MSVDSLYSSIFLAQETMNSSDRLLKGSCSLFLLPYKAMLLRLQWRSNHLRKEWLIYLSKAATVVGGRH